MSQFNPMLVWTEREGDIAGTPAYEGDWEACVATSYAMGLLYGGVTMPAPYTQAERERLEAVYDEPQDLATSDIKAIQVYGKKLRPPSVTTSKAAFLARPGMGFCLTGTGSPVGAQIGTFMHEVFAVAQSTTVVRVYDPLRAPGSQPTDMTVTALATWMKGVGSNDVREIRKDEFMPSYALDTVPFLGSNGQPTPRQVSFAAGKTYRFWPLTGGTPKSYTPASASSAPADVSAAIWWSDNRAPHGGFTGSGTAIPGTVADRPFVRMSAGTFTGLYLVARAGDGTVAPNPPIGGGGHTDAELEQAKKDANKAGYNEGRGAVQAAAAGVPPKT
jgi:hypothetical protein